MPNDGVAAEEPTIDSEKQRHDELTEIVKREFQRIGEKMQTLLLTVENTRLRDRVTTAEERPWWVVAAGVIAVPAAIVTILLNVSEVSLNFDTQRKTVAEAALAEVQTDKARAELQQLVAGIEEQKRVNPSGYEQALRDALPRMDQLLTELKNSKPPSGSFPVALLVKFVLLWIVISAIGVFFDIVSMAWSVALGFVHRVIYDFRLKDTDRKSRFARTVARTRRIYPWTEVVLSRVPQFASWAVYASVLLLVSVPLAAEVAQYLGASNSFLGVLDAARHLEFSKAIAKLAELMAS